MATSPPFSGRLTGWGVYSKAATLPHSFLPVKTCHLKCDKVKKSRVEAGLSCRLIDRSNTNPPVLYKTMQICRKLQVVMSSESDFSTGFQPPSPSGTIKQFFTCINSKDLTQISKLISHDCVFEDCSFPKPFQGKKEVMDFLKQLTDSMGRNVEFKVGYVCGGDDFTAGVTWHLEWNKKQIPFTTGCSFYKCSMKGSTLLIKKAQVVTESPVKPGGSALILLKIVTSLFDTFPKATERFLKSQEAVFQIILKLYNMVWGPLFSPFLGWYIKLWEFFSRLLSYVLTILIFICKNFY